MKKLTYDFVKNSFEDEGYVLLSRGYENSHSKLLYTCPNDHQGSITWANWQQGRRCSKCSAIRSGELRKLDFDSVRRAFAEEGYVLSSKKYRNSWTKLDYICPNNHKHSMTWNDWQQGTRCPFCLGVAKLTYEFVKESFEKEGYTLLSREYLNSGTKLLYSCPEGHKNSMCWDNWKQGKRCPTCAGVAQSLRQFGADNPNWSGGVSFRSYCPVWKDKEYKESIKDRDNYQCLNPYCNKKDEELVIHHVDYDKENCGPDNLITVCRSCNARANSDREWHTAWYKAILNKRYNY